LSFRSQIVNIGHKFTSHLEKGAAMARVLTLEEVASYLRVHPSTIYRLLKKKQLPAFKVGSDWRFNLESIDRWRAEAEQGRVGGKVEYLSNVKG
jgi:excisionase family DNA binding protein